MAEAPFRFVLDESRVHPSVRAVIRNNHRDLVERAIKAINQYDVVVLGMAQNPFCRRARRILEAKGIPYEYIEEGSYLSKWRRRNALKMWTGWPTFPMVFVKGILIGGAEDLERLMASGEFEALLRGGRQGEAHD
ncbi:MAG: glutaredoxin [Sandaracinaceae bacterium]|nr:glutaredoxin [Sandaracinaceae bacterium]MDW8246192.1 glutaredoxin [Sandaracinaceae bacterium]